MVEHRNEIALTAQLAVVGNGKAVRLIADALNEVQRSAFTVQHNTFALVRLEDFLLALSQTYNRQIIKTKAANNLQRRAQLTLAAVDNH